MVFVSFNRLLKNIEVIITLFAPYSKHFFLMSLTHFEMSFASNLLNVLCVIAFGPTWIITISGRSSS